MSWRNRLPNIICVCHGTANGTGGPRLGMKKYLVAPQEFHKDASSVTRRYFPIELSRE